MPSTDQNIYTSLNHSFSKEEVQKALFDLHPSKAPGPDGFTAFFYQDAWDTVGDVVTKAVLGVLNEGGSLKD